MRRIEKTRWLGMLFALCGVAGVMAQEFPVLLALRRATTLEVRGWGPATTPGSASAAYAFGQVVDMPQMQLLRSSQDGLSAEGTLTTAGIGTFAGAGETVHAMSTGSANFLLVASPGFGPGRDFGDGLATLGIACGEFHTLLLKRDGTVTGRGWDGLGQATVPSGLTNVVSVACGLDHSVAVLSDGRAVLWGRNDLRQSEIAEADNHGFVAAAAGLLHTVLLRGDGTIHFTHPSFGPELAGIPTIRDAVGVAAGAAHSVVLHRDGRVNSFGRTFAASARVPVEARGCVAVAAGGFFSLALRSDGRVVAWGDNTYGQTVVPASATNVVAIAAGSFHAVALRSDGTLVVWGEGSNGALAVPPGLKDVVAVAAGGYHTQVLVRTGPSLSAPRRTGAGWVSDVFLPAGTRYTVERSVDLRSWSQAAVRVIRPGTLTLDVSGEIPDGAGFLRLRSWIGAVGNAEW
jgi:Regulator of chromosome condensation (RCC1) repeat